jgi:hypothetical protein
MSAVDSNGLLLKPHFLATYDTLLDKIVATQQYITKRIEAFKPKVSTMCPQEVASR